jgi:hypothetical protein
VRQVRRLADGCAGCARRPGVGEDVYVWVGDEYDQTSHRDGTYSTIISALSSPSFPSRLAHLDIVQTHRFRYHLVILWKRRAVG